MVSVFLSRSNYSVESDWTPAFTVEPPVVLLRKVLVNNAVTQRYQLCLPCSTAVNHLAFDCFSNLEIMTTGMPRCDCANQNELSRSEIPRLPVQSARFWLAIFDSSENWLRYCISGNYAKVNRGENLHIDPRYVPTSRQFATARIYESTTCNWLLSRTNRFLVPRFTRTRPKLRRNRLKKLSAIAFIKDCNQEIAYQKNCAVLRWRCDFWVLLYKDEKSRFFFQESAFE